MGRVRLKIRELAEEKGWTLQDVAVGRIFGRLRGDRANGLR
jgi:hypothetical protein